jgi:hypothetical protein
MTGKTINLILLGVLVGVLLGGILGAVIPDAMRAIGLVGTLYVNALAIVAIVLVLIGFPLALARYGDLRRFDNESAGKFVITVASAVVVIALGVVLVRLVAAEAINPHGFTAGLMTDLFQIETRITGDYLGTLIPEGLMRAVLQGSYLGWVIFALIFGMVLPTISSRTRTLHSLFEDITGTVIRISELLLVLAPLAMLFIAGALVARNRLGVGEMFSELWYPLVLVIAIIMYAAIVLPLAITWWNKTQEIRGRREEPSRGRPGQPVGSGRPGQRPMGQDRSRGRDQRFDRDRAPRDRDQRPDRDRGDRDRNERGDRGDRERGDRDRDRGRRDFRRDRDRTESPRPESARRETPREDSPFAVSKSAHTFDPEVPNQPVAVPEVHEEIQAPVIPVERSQADPEIRRDRGDRPDRGPRDRHDRDNRGGRDRQGRGGRDRGRSDRPRRFERPEATEAGQPSGGSSFTPRESEDIVDSGADRLAEGVFGVGGAPAFEPAEREISERPGADRDEQPDTDRYTRPEPTHSSAPERKEPESRPSRDESEQPVQYGRSSHTHRPQSEESSADSNKAPEPEPSAEAPKPIDHYSTDGIAFGRGNRRKNRR